MMNFSSDLLESLQKKTEADESPFFFYDLDFLVEHIKKMEEQTSDSTTLWYACKANPMSAILKIFRNRGFGIDVASLGELDQVTRAGIKAKNVIATGPAKSKSYLKKMINAGVGTIVLESINQMKDLDQVSQELGKKTDCLLRVQLEWEGGSSVLGGNEVTPFGIGENDWKNIDISQFKQLNILGLHAFQWGNLLDLNSIETIWDSTCNKLVQFSKEINIDLQVLDLGGGIGIPYQLNKSAPEFLKINPIIEKLKKKYSLKNVWLELGRYAVGECGYYFAKVIDRKISRGKEILVLNGGINHIARPALTDQAFPVERFDKQKAKNKKEISFKIHGPLCTALDNLGEHSLPSDTNVGDWLVFHKVGAYGFTEAMPFFLCHDLPSESIYYNGDFMTPRVSKTSADWMI
ncbi:MAG: diaminopimelate decarboxylase [Halobacteriovoraceae bacterium]|nr:diaminopimelate decarboxylase [Halobacteriovoraceae bacterium]